jgi:trimethylamine---corrinoid protein Co-methyltransferase
LIYKEAQMPIRGLKGGMLKFLNDEDLESIHIATLEILSEVGVKMEYEPALEILKEHGADVDFDSKVVKIDEGLLNKASMQLYLQGLLFTAKTAIGI